MAADLALPSLTTQYVQVVVQAQYQGAPYDPTADEVQFAFVVGSGYPTTWYTGSWQTTIQSNYIAQCLVGPNGGAVALAPATYVVWLKILDVPETPVLSAGSLQIT